MLTEHTPNKNLVNSCLHSVNVLRSQLLFLNKRRGKDEHTVTPPPITPNHTFEEWLLKFQILHFWNSRFCMFETAQLKWAYFFFFSINSVFCNERKLQFFPNRNLGHISACFHQANIRFEIALKTLNSHMPFIPTLQKQRQGDRWTWSFLVYTASSTLLGHTLRPCQMNNFKKN